MEADEVFLADLLDESGEKTFVVVHEKKLIKVTIKKNSKDFDVFDFISGVFKKFCAIFILLRFP